MISTDELAFDRAGIVSHNRSAPVLAGIVESIDLIILVPNEQNRRSGSGPQLVAAAFWKLIFMPGVQLGCRPQRLTFECLKRRVRIAAAGNVGQRRKRGGRGLATAFVFNAVQ